MGPNASFDDLPDDDLALPLNLRSFGKRTLTDHEHRGLSRAVTALMQLIQLDKLRMRELQNLSRGQALDEGRVKVLRDTSEDMTQLLGEIQKLTPALTTTAQRIVPEMRAALDEWVKDGKLTLRSTADVAFESDPVTLAANEWIDPWVVTRTSSGGVSAPTPKQVEQLGQIVEAITTPTKQPSPIEQVIVNVGAQAGIEQKQVQQGVAEIIAGKFDPQTATSVAVGIAGAFFGGGGGSGGGGEISAVTVGALFGSLVGAPEIGVLVGLVVDFLLRVLAEDETPNS